VDSCVNRDVGFLPLSGLGADDTWAREKHFTISRWAELPTNEEHKHMAKTIPMKEVDRSAVTGRFVTGKYAESHPRTTEHEHVPISNPKKK
jgi:hypothetical protein